MSETATSDDAATHEPAHPEPAPQRSAAPPEADHGHHPNYWAIFLVLCGLTAVSWILDESVGWGLMKSHVVLSALVLAVALAKALFVAVYFMHLKFEGRWKYVLLTPTLVLALGLPLALMPDLSFQYYPADTAQSRYLRARGESPPLSEQAGESEDGAASAPYADDATDPEPREAEDAE